MYEILSIDERGRKQSWGLKFSEREAIKRAEKLWSDPRKFGLDFNIKFLLKKV